MSQGELILDRYEPLGTAGEGGFGTVQIAWDPRIQRKVAIKTIKLTALDAARAALPGAQAVAVTSTQASAGAGIQSDAGGQADAGEDARWPADAQEPVAEWEPADAWEGEWPALPDVVTFADEADPAAEPAQVTSLAHLPGLDEARTAAKLSDSRIVTVFDFEVRGRMAYLIMEYVEGITLTELLADYPEYLTLDMVASVFDAMAGALEVAHGAGVLHLDIKPDNILINAQGKVKVTDFGLATLADASGVGKTGGGTIGYMPLEQMRRERLDARTDEWSLASVAYEMLTGSNPFCVPGLEAAERAIEQAELVLPSLCWENLDDQVDDVIFYALDPDREQRYASVADFAEELDKFLGNAEEGTEQLALVVADALGLEEDPADEEGFADVDGDGANSRAAHTRGRASGLLGRLKALFGLGASGEGAGQPADAPEAYGTDERARTDDVAEEVPTYPGWRTSSERELARLEADQGADARSKAGRSPVLPERAVAVAPRLLSACASGFTAFLALANMHVLAVGFGPGAPYVIIAAAMLVAIIGAIFSGVGALLAFSLLGVSIILCGHPVVGAIVLVAAVLWWYTIGHEGMASANVALLVPVLGAVGASSAVPLLAGASLKPPRAVGTTVFALVVALAMGSFGADWLLGWDAFAHWDYSRADITRNALRMATSPATWTTAIGWLAATTLTSAFALRGSRLLSIVGVALALVALLLGTLAQLPPSPQLVVPAILATTAILAAKR